MPGRKRFFGPVLAIFWLTTVVPATHAGPSAAEIGARLKAAYPDFVSGVSGNTLTFKDGTALPLDDGRGNKTFAEWLADPDIKDMFRYPYPRGGKIAPPDFEFDPGRARNEAFFTKIYGDCRARAFADSLTAIQWLPKKGSGQRIAISNRNGVAEHLRSVSDELDALPQKFDAYLIPSAGGYVCRTIAGTPQRSGHGYGIAIDIATKHSDYWRWAKGGLSGRPVYRNAIPIEIVDIFEKHGFIWGGRWSHYDTMHFEYRPELLNRAN